MSAATGGIRFFISGAGGELRRGNVQKNMARAHIQAWAEQNHFLEVDLDGKTMTVTPLSSEPLKIVDSSGGRRTHPIHRDSQLTGRSGNSRSRCPRATWDSIMIDFHG